MNIDLLMDLLNRAADEGKQHTFWLRDDDAIEPSDRLETLLALTDQARVPLTLASVPAGATTALAQRIEAAPHVSIAVHGWRHVNHAPAGEKKQELGLHRGEAKIIEEIESGLTRISSLFGAQSVAMLVPPWNRIDSTLLPLLNTIGFRALSVFGPEKREAPVPLLNTHVDIIDWKGNRGGRGRDILFAEIAERIETLTGDPLDTVGILTHHLDHDTAAWDFLEELFAHTADHPACRWMRSETILAATNA